MKILIKILLMGLAVALSAYIIPGAEVRGFFIAIIVGLVIALLNSTVGAILRLFTLPLNILTFGLVGFAISVLMIMLASSLLEGFNAGGFLNAALFALVLAIIGGLFGSFEIKK